MDVKSEKAIPSMETISWGSTIVGTSASVTSILHVEVPEDVNSLETALLKGSASSPSESDCSPERVLVEVGKVAGDVVASERRNDEHRRMVQGGWAILVPKLHLSGDIVLVRITPQSQHEFM